MIENFDAKRMGPALVFVARDKGFIQRAFSKLTGIPQPRISAYGRGAAAPTVEHLYRMAQALQLTMDEVYELALEPIRDPEPSDGLTAGGDMADNLLL